MAFKERKIIEPLVEFIKTCPLLKGNEIDIGELGFDYDATAIAYTGTPQPLPRRDILGGVQMSKQANFVVYMRRSRNDNYNRLKATELLHNFENWVEYENLFGEPPRIGDEPETERIWADNGVFFEVDEDKQGYAVYQIQMHIQYVIDYS